MTTRKTTKPKAIPAVSRRLPSGDLLELVHDAKNEQTSFILGQDSSYKSISRYQSSKQETLVPYSPKNSLLAHRVVLFPSEPITLESKEQLIRDIKAYIARYVSISPEFLTVAAYYVLLTWVYDQFRELPYLRAKGDFGTGKTRFLLTIGSICYKPMFASGASTISPLFHMIDIFRGTLIIDEADFRVSDDKAEIVKILNNGNARGFPVLRSEQSPTGEFRPRAFNVFGPKIIATRGTYDDAALESRLITEDMNRRRPAAGVPISLPEAHSTEALRLRNALLTFRLHHLNNLKTQSIASLSAEPRLRQIFSPLFALIDDAEDRNNVISLLLAGGRSLLESRRYQIEYQLVYVLGKLSQDGNSGSIAVGDVAKELFLEFRDDYQKPVTARWTGAQLRTRLDIEIAKTNGRYIIAPGQGKLLHELRERYG